MMRLIVAIVLSILVAACAKIPRPVEEARAERAAKEAARVPKDSKDAAIFSQLIKAGHDLSKPTMVEFFAFFPEEASARATLQVLSGKGYTGEIRQSEGEWLCHLRKTMVIDADAIDMERFLFRDLTVNAGGRYAGWQAQIVH